MTTTNPIVPPPELVAKWCAWCGEIETAEHFWQRIATQAAQWGADQELEACVKWLDEGLMTPYVAIGLRSDRRPKPPSLKEQALHELNDVYNRDKIEDSTYDTIRRALEQL